MVRFETLEEPALHTVRVLTGGGPPGNEELVVVRELPKIRTARVADGLPGPEPAELIEPLAQATPPRGPLGRSA